MSRRGSALPFSPADDTSVLSPEERWLSIFGTLAPARLPTLVAQTAAWHEQVLVQGDVSAQIARDLKVAATEALRRRQSTALE